MPFPRLLPTTLLIVAAGSGFLTAAEEAAPAGDIWEALTGGTPAFSTRVRLETVNDDAYDEDALGLVTDTTLSYQTASFHHTVALIEFEGVHHVFDADFNSGRNGNTSYPPIVDPEGDEINRLWLRYDGFEGFELKLGRQRIIYDNARHIGNVGWRANEQTFDALSLRYDGTDNLLIRGALLANINTIKATNMNLEPGILLNGAYTVADIGTLTGYGYALDYKEDQNSGTDLLTMGLRFVGTRELGDELGIGYEVEVAQQSDYGDSDDISALYAHLVASVSWQRYRTKLGYELLGSDDGNWGFAFPLGTNHKFNGFADKFLGTPAVGLQDLYVGIGATMEEMASIPGRLAADLVFHSFASDEGSTDFGTEIDLLVTWKQNLHLAHGFKLSQYSEGDDGTASDATRIALWTTLSF